MSKSEEMHSSSNLSYDTYKDVNSIDSSSPAYKFCKSILDINLKNAKGFTPIQRAIIDNNLQALYELLKLGANPDIQNELGETALYLSVALNNIDSLIILLQYKANCNIQKKNGNSPLHLAVKKKQYQFISTLLRNKANPNIVNKLYSQTPTHLALINKVNKDILNEFHANKADIFHIKDKFGKTPFDYAKNLRDQNYLNLLKKVFKKELKNNYITEKFLTFKYNEHYMEGNDADILKENNANINNSNFINMENNKFSYYIDKNENNKCSLSSKSDDENKGKIKDKEEIENSMIENSINEYTEKKFRDEVKHIIGDTIKKVKISMNWSEETSSINIIPEKKVDEINGADYNSQKLSYISDNSKIKNNITQSCETKGKNDITDMNPLDMMNQIIVNKNYTNDSDLKINSSNINMNKSDKNTSNKRSNNGSMSNIKLSSSLEYSKSSLNEDSKTVENNKNSELKEKEDNNSLNSTIYQYNNDNKSLNKINIGKINETIINNKENIDDRNSKFGFYEIIKRKIFKNKNCYNLNKDKIPREPIEVDSCKIKRSNKFVTNNFGSLKTSQELYNLNTNYSRFVDNNVDNGQVLQNNVSIDLFRRLRDWLVSCDLLYYYNLLIGQNVYDIDSYINGLKTKKLNLSYGDIENIGIKKPGHIFRFLLKLKMDSGLLDTEMCTSIVNKFSQNTLSTSILTSIPKVIKCCGISIIKEGKNGDYLNNKNININHYCYNDIVEFLKDNELIKYEDNFIHNGFDQIDYLFIQLFSEYKFNKKILNNCMHIYLEKDQEIVLQKLYELKKRLSLELDIKYDIEDDQKTLSTMIYGDNNVCRIF